MGYAIAIILALLAMAVSAAIIIIQRRRQGQVTPPARQNESCDRQAGDSRAVAATEHPPPSPGARNSSEAGIPATLSPPIEHEAYEAGPAGSSSRQNLPCGEDTSTAHLDVDSLDRSAAPTDSSGASSARPPEPEPKPPPPKAASGGPGDVAVASWQAGATDEAGEVAGTEDTSRSANEPDPVTAASAAAPSSSEGRGCTEVDSSPATTSLDDQQIARSVEPNADGLHIHLGIEVGGQPTAADDTVGDKRAGLDVGGTTQHAEATDSARVAQAQAEGTELRASAEEQDTQTVRPAEKSDRSRTPRTYRPTPRAPLQGRNSRQSGPATASRNRAMRVEVRVRFERGGFCSVSLLPQRDAAFPSEIAVKGHCNPPTLLALQDDWFQDVSLDGIGNILLRGLVWRAKVEDLGTVWWNLSGREIFVLGRRTDLSGYVTIPKLVLGEDHAVLCTEGRLPAVLDALLAAGCAEPALLRADLGAPDGWVVLRNVTPQLPVASSPDGDILDALRPLANVEIALLNGIRLMRTTWLVGHPPQVHVRGDADEIGDVLIDGRRATRSASGNYVAEGWDAVGTHEVWCPSASKSYTIQEGPEQWDAWAAYDWSLGEPASTESPVQAAICGMRVLPHDRQARGRGAVSVPTSNRLLVGRHPGQIFVCPARADLRASTQVAFPWFTPVWALPLHALSCDKRVTRIILISDVSSAAPPTSIEGTMRSAALMAWCTAILDAGRKRLDVAPVDDTANDLWRKYRRIARDIWRRRR